MPYLLHQPETAQHLKQMTTATHTLTNGLQNFIFEVTEDVCLIKFVNCFGAITETMEFTIEEGRKQWKLALDCGCERGYTNPRRSEPSAFDDNRWEEELALAQG
jgi:hypothetical protein